MKRLIVAALVIALVLMAGCVEEEVTPTASPTATLTATVTETATPGVPTSPTVSETLRERHAGKALPAEPTKDDCLGCHQTIVDTIPHTKHVTDLGFDCTKCHAVDDPLPAFKMLVPIETCTVCHPGYFVEGAEVSTTPAAEGVEPSGHWASCISCHADKEDHISQYAEDCTACHGSGMDANVHDKEGHSDLGCMDSECHK
jgi:hypothetical protein